MPNAAGAGLAALVTQAYAAIDDDAHWQAWVDGFARLFEHAYGLLLVDERNGRPPRIAVCSQPEALEHYLRSARDTDPLLDNVTLGQMSASRRAWLSHELISERSLRESAFYADFLLPQGNLFYGIGGNYLLAPDLLVQVWAYRGKAHGAFDAQDGELGDLLVRPLLHALELGAHLRQLREEAVHHEAVQDQLIDAVLVLDADNRLLHANARGRDLLEGVARGHVFNARALRLVNAGEQQRLQLALERARHHGAPLTLRLLRQKPLPPLYAVLLGSADGAAAGMLRLFLRDPRWQKFLPEDDLVDVFDLTAAQARVCAAVVRGESIEDIAARLDVQLTTVRAQLKAAMEKIGMHRQTDLVRHLSMAMPALLHPQTPTR